MQIISKTASIIVAFSQNTPPIQVKATSSAVGGQIGTNITVANRQTTSYSEIGSSSHPTGNPTEISIFNGLKRWTSSPINTALSGHSTSKQFPPPTERVTKWKAKYGGNVLIFVYPLTSHLLLQALNRQTYLHGSNQNVREGTRNQNNRAFKISEPNQLKPGPRLLLEQTAQATKWSIEMWD